MTTVSTLPRPRARRNGRKSALEEHCDQTRYTMYGSLVCADPAAHSALELVARIAPSDVPVLISGESGTGKEAVARYLHESSGRSGPFLAINCGAIIEQRHDRSRASHGRGVGLACESWFSAANRGTLFLDEIGKLPLQLQAQLVCGLQAREPARASKAQAPDVRLVTTTTAALTDVVAAGEFRRDLFYRLNLAQVSLLPLRERRGDIVPLARHFIRGYARQLNLQPPLLDPGAALMLAQHSWPGNIRQLQNVIRLALLLAPAGRLESEHLSLTDSVPRSPLAGSSDQAGEPLLYTLRALLAQMFQAPGRHLLEQLEGQIIAQAFHFTARNQVRTAALLGITRNVLRTLLRKHQLYEIRAYSHGDPAAEVDAAEG